MCEHCIGRLKDGETVTARCVPESEDTGSPEEFFEELFRAGRALLRKQVEAEDTIVPTLVAADEIGRGVKRWITIKDRVLSEGPGPLRSSKVVDGARHTAGPRNLRAIEVVEEALILERMPVSAEAVKSPHPVLPGSRRPPSEFLIRFFPHARAATAEEARDVYREALEEEGVFPGEGHGGSVDYEFAGQHLYLRVKEMTLQRGMSDNPDKSGFPPSHQVGRFARVLLEEYGARLLSRKRGSGMAGVHLIPACVAVLLKQGGVRGRSEIQRLLNRELLAPVHGRSPFPESGYSTSESTQLWQNHEKAQKLIARTIETM